MALVLVLVFTNITLTLTTTPCNDIVLNPCEQRVKEILEDQPFPLPPHPHHFYGLVFDPIIIPESYLK